MIVRYNNELEMNLNKGYFNIFQLQEYQKSIHLKSRVPNIKAQKPMIFNIFFIINTNKT